MTGRRTSGLWLLAALAAGGCGTPATQQEGSPAEPRPPVSAGSAVDRAVATTGDLITYTVTVDHDPAYTVELPEPGSEIAGFRIVDLGREESAADDGRRVQRRWYELRADLVGSYVLPPVTVRYWPRPASGEGGAGGEVPADALTLQTSEIFVEVESVLPQDGEVTDIRGLKPLVAVEEPLPWGWIAAGAAVLGLALATAVALWLRRRRTPAAPPAPAHEIAFAALDALRHTDFDDPEQVRRFHFRISEVVRAYVEGRFGVNATDLTTEEILARLEGLESLADEDRRTLRRFSLATDRVKFAHYHPAESEIEAVYEQALSFVESTRPVAVAVQGETPESGGETPATAAPAAGEEAA